MSQLGQRRLLRIRNVAFYLFVLTALLSCYSIQRLEQSQLQAFAGFGVSIDIGAYAIIGANQELVGDAQGAAYLFRRRGDAWSISARLGSPDPDNERFGSAVAVSSTLAAVGAPQDSRPGAVETGSVYIFRRTGVNWNHIQTINSPLPHQGFENFGHTLAIGGSYLIVGAMFRDHGGFDDAGSAYVYEWNGAEYVLLDTLTAPVPGESERFGAEIEIKRDTLFVSAPQSDADSTDNAGAVFVYKNIRDNFSLDQTLIASDRADGDLFGSGLAVYEGGDFSQTLVVGAEGKNARGLDSVGAAYVFDSPQGGAFTETVKLMPSDGGAGDLFGTDVGIWNQSIVVGASGEDNIEIDAGAAYAFLLDNGVWSEEEKLIAPNPSIQSQMGTAVEIKGAHTLIGAVGMEINPGQVSGVVHMFARPTTPAAWHHGQSITPAQSTHFDFYGRTIAWDNANMIISGTQNADIFGQDINAFSLTQTLSPEPGSNILAATISGDSAAIFAHRIASPLPIGYLEVYTQQNDVWTSQQLIEPDLVSMAAPNESANSTVLAMEGDTIVVGARRWNGGDGRVFVYTRSGGLWTQQQMLMSPQQASNFDLNYGNHVEIDGDWLAVAEVPSSGVPGSPRSGNIFIYNLVAGQYVEQQILTEPVPAVLDQFGAGLAMSGDLLAVYGASSEVLRVYRRVAGVYSEIWSTIVADVGSTDAGLAITDEFVAIGAGNTDINGEVDQGEVVVFERQPDDSYTLHFRLRANDTEAGSRLGKAILMNNTNIVVSTAPTNPVGKRVYVFDM